MRKAPALFASAGLLLVTLTGCSPLTSASCGNPADAGGATDLIHVSGEVGSKPKVDLSTPLHTRTTERDIIVRGDGDLVTEHDTAVINWVLLNGRTGEVITESDFSKPGSVMLSLPGQFPGFKKALECAPIGSRVTAAIAAKDALGPNGGSPQEDIRKTDTLVLVADIDRVVLSRANGAERPTPAGFPTVVVAPDGHPGVTVPSGAAPKQVKAATIRQGDGATIKKGDTVTVAYAGVLWNEKTVFDSSWDTGEPLTFVAGEPGLLEDFNKAVTGAQVGSQIILVLPPEAAYGDQGSGSVPGGATLIFVIDVLGVSPGK